MRVIDDTVDPPVIIFDSNEKLLNCPGLAPGTSGIVAGSITLPARQAYTPNWNNAGATTNISTNHLLASVNPAANVVLGGFQVTTFGGAQGIAGLGVFNAGGNYVHTQFGNSGVSDPGGAPINSSLTNFAMYRFFASAGSLYLHEYVWLSTGSGFAEVSVTTTLLSIRFDYKLFVGTLT